MYIATYYLRRYITTYVVMYISTLGTYYIPSKVLRAYLHSELPEVLTYGSTT